MEVNTITIFTVTLKMPKIFFYLVIKIIVTVSDCRDIKNCTGYRDDRNDYWHVNSHNSDL